MVVAGFTGRPASIDDELPADACLATEFGELTKHKDVDRRRAIKALATKYSVSAREIFKRLEDAKRSGE